MSSEKPIAFSELYDSKGVSRLVPERLYGENLYTGRSYFSPLRTGTLEALQLVPNHFSDIDDPEKNNPYNLAEFLRIDYRETPVYIVDNHQYALYAWAEAVKEGRLNMGATLVHYDAHTDSSPSEVPLRTTRHQAQNTLWSLDDIISDVRRLGCWDFIDPAIQVGIINHFYHIEPSNPSSPFQVSESKTTIEYLCLGIDSYVRDIAPTLTKKKKVVDVDLDYFVGKGFSKADKARQIDILRADIQTAGVATFATSPGYIDPEYAVRLVKEILS
jgi:hypothetical protein